MAESGQTPEASAKARFPQGSRVRLDGRDEAATPTSPAPPENDSAEEQLLKMIGRGVVPPILHDPTASSRDGPARRRKTLAVT